MINAFSIDVEEWYHPQLLKPAVKNYKKCIQINDALKPILDLLDKYNTKATFFILGELAQNNPRLIKEIYSQGHEIASHGMDHSPLWDLNRQSLAQQLDNFQDVITAILGLNVRIKGYRAPSFSLNNSTRWALGVLREKGYLYDSSIFPTKNKLYGLYGAPLKIYRPSVVDLREEDPNFEFWEFPLSVCDILGVKIPVAGGFYFRTMPLFLLKNFLKRINKKRPFVFYLHPWESYEHTPRIKGLSTFNYFISYWGISGVLKKLEDLLKSFSFQPICEVLGV